MKLHINKKGDDLIQFMSSWKSQINSFLDRYVETYFIDEFFTQSDGFREKTNKQTKLILIGWKIRNSFFENILCTT